MTEPAADEASKSRQVLRAAVIGGLAIALLFGFDAFLDAHDTRGLPIESVRVLKAEETKGDFECSRRGTAGRDFFVESSDPPDDLPERFWIRRTCYEAVGVGDDTKAAREVRNGKVVQAWIDPAVSYQQATERTVAGFLIGFVGFGVLSFLLRRLRQAVLKRIGDSV